jgi:hypothetical protein
MGAMRRLLVMILLAGAFLGGYYLRGLDGSPDVFGWIREKHAKFSEAGQTAAAEAHHEEDRSLYARLADRFQSE